MIKNGKYVLRGMKDHDRIISEIIDNLNAEHIAFDIKLILTEALVNAYMHGNKGNDELPIFLKYCYDDTCVTFKIQDCGNGCDFLNLQNKPTPESCLEENGRGIYLIMCYSDNVEMIENKLIIEKSLIKEYLTK